MSFEWKETTIEESVEINPSYTLKKGALAKKISMADLEAFTRKVVNYEVAKFNGGSKFKNGDTLMARITPCLENGKTSFVNVLENDEIGFGSTEFIVLRGKEGISDNKYVYYLSISPDFRNTAIKSMTGTSGRQRAQVEAISNWQFRLPPIYEQQEIAALLSSLDDKIELNNAINKNLEAMAQALFKQWFVDFEFPNENGEPYKSSGGEFEESELGLIPKGWSVGTFQDLISDTVGGDWGKEAPQGNYTKEVSCIRGADIPEITKGLLGKVPKRFILPKNATAKSLSHGDIIIEISGGSPTQSTGRSVLIIEEVLNKFNTPLICTNFCRVIKPIIGYSEFLYCYLSYLYNEDVFFQYENGTTGIKNLDIGSLLSVHKIVIPIKSVLQQYSAQYQAVYSTIQHLGRESDQLAQIRDTLLPKLMSGEIRVPVERDNSATDLPKVAESNAIYQP